jgi:hypothetical protein
LIKLGAVVGVGEFASGPATGARWLDRSFLGASLAGFGTGQVVLEGMPVRLGPDLDPDDDGLSTPEEMALGTQPEQADSDGDGLPDGWEVRHGLDPLSPEGTNGASGDPDGDGFANAAEFAAGTRPNDAASALRLSARPLAGGGIEFRWPAVPGRSYALEWAAAPGAEFHNLDEPGLPRTAVAPWESYSLAGRPDGDAARFFRLRLLP